jgi:hypothetical protein
MFGLFKSRPKYNGTVDTKLNNEYQIDTRGKAFPGPASYLKILDLAWQTGMNEDEAAMYVATLYFCGIMKAGLEDEAARILERLNSVGDFGLSKGMIDGQRHAKFIATIKEAIVEYHR